MSNFNLLLGSFILGSMTFLNSQVLYNNGCMLHVDAGGVVQVNGSLENDQLGDFENFGYVTIENSVILSNSSNTLGDGVYNVGGDWTNNANFNGGASDVNLFGSDQYILGSQVSDFHNLTLTGSGVKYLGVNSSAYGVLGLNDRELATEGFVFTVSSTAIGAIQRTSGFVSSLTGGYLERYTSASGVYLFPTGSSLGVIRYRPIEIIPASSNTNHFTARLANNDATLDSYDRNFIGDTVCTTNPYWYHLIGQSLGADDVDLTVYFDETEDGPYDGIAQWEGLTTSQWESVGLTMVTSTGSLEGITTQNWNDFTTEPFVLIDRRPDLPVIAGSDQICGGFSVNYEAWNSPTGIYEWEVTGGNILSQNDSSSMIEVEWGIGTNGVVSVYSTENGCRSVDPAELTVSLLDVPTALYNFGFLGNSAGNIAFQDSSLGNIISYEWDFGDGEFSNEENPYHSYDEPGTYYATLLVENLDGCLDTIVDTILIKEQLIVPDVFTPNNDGYNDMFVATNMGVCDFTISIYNRWGELVYQTTNPSIAWDGKTRSGENASEGTYYFVVEANSCEDDKIDYGQRHYLTLVRE